MTDSAIQKGPENWFKKPDKKVGNGSGDGYGSDMDTRLAILEHRADAADRRMERMEGKLDTLLDRTAKMPTISGMWGMIATVIGVCAASLGVVIAILTWLQGFHH